jgi:ribosome-binding factor A
MKRNSRRNDSLSRYRANVDADDGLDPRDFFQKEGRSRGVSRKAQQLRAQVAETLQQVFGESSDAVLQSLRVVEVRAAADASQLLVLTAPAVGAQITADDAVSALARAGGWLRSEVARAITRKRAPQLVFRMAPPAMGKEAQQ